jgi:hypothetical protein
VKRQKESQKYYERMKARAMKEDESHRHLKRKERERKRKEHKKLERKREHDRERREAKRKQKEEEKKNTEREEGQNQGSKTPKEKHVRTFSQCEGVFSSCQKLANHLSTHKPPQEEQDEVRALSFHFSPFCIHLSLYLVWDLVKTQL